MNGCKRPAGGQLEESEHTLREEAKDHKLHCKSVEYHCPKYKIRKTSRHHPLRTSTTYQPLNPDHHSGKRKEREREIGGDMSRLFIGSFVIDD